MINYDYMEFLAIMIVGTLAAIWVVVHSRPTRPMNTGIEDVSHAFDFSPPESPASMKGVEYVQPMGEMEYLEAVERHDKDPAHYPFPSPPPRLPRPDSFTDES